MSHWTAHLIILPIILPMISGASMLLLGGSEQRTAKAVINVISTIALMVIALILLIRVDVPAGESPVSVYLLGNWSAPFGIVLVVDRLSALMVMLTTVLAMASLIFSLARWHKMGAHFHSLFQFLLMGLNGAFLTGDLFNLFVFFEVFLVASYGLVLHGSGVARVKAGLHYIAINLAASMVFLIGVSLIYSVTGTLNMADLAVRIPQIIDSDRMLFEAGVAILGIAFLVKAGMWPLCFWLPTTYAAACPPVAALFAIMSKVGIYIILRLWLLLFGDDAGSSAYFGGTWIIIGGMMTLAFGTISVLASQDMGRMASYTVLISTGTLLAAIGVGEVSVTASALYYLISSTLTICAFFLLIELAERDRDAGADMLAVTMEAFGDNIDGEETAGHDEIGTEIPATMAVLGTCFVSCTVLLAGLPPLSSFIAKFALLTTLLNPAGLGSESSVSVFAWIFLALLILSGLTVIIAMMRAGIRVFWTPSDRAVPKVKVVEIAPIITLLFLCLCLTFMARPALRYMQATAQSLHTPQHYIQDVLATPRVQKATMEEESP